MNYNKIRLSEFKLEKMVPNPAIVMIAKRGSGKSYITRDIMYNFRHIPGGVVISYTDRMNPFYKYFFPDLYIHYEIKDNILSKILRRQTLMIEKSKELKKKGKWINPAGILIMDDCLADKKSWARDRSTSEILMNGRHYQLTYLLTMQTPLGVTPDLRLNFDYYFLLKEDSGINKKKLFDNYANVFPSQHAFEIVFSKCTEDYRAMVIDNRKPADNLQDKVFWFKAKERKFSFGSRSFRNLHKKCYDPEFRKRINPEFMDATALLGRKRKSMGEIRVDFQ